MKLKLTTAALCLMPLLSHANSNNEFSYFGLALQNNNYDINFIPSIEQDSFAPLNYSDEQSGINQALVLARPTMTFPVPVLHARLAALRPYP